MKRTLLIFMSVLLCVITMSNSVLAADYSPDNSYLDENGKTTVDATGDYKTSDYTEQFSSPANEYRWHTINHGLADDVANGANPDHSLAWGVGGLVTNITWDNKYVDEPSYFADLNAAVNYYMSAGMEIWLYDELGYPSGSAGGRVTQGHDEYVARGIVCKSYTGYGYSSKTVTKDSHSEIIGIYCAYVIDSKGNVTNLSTNGNSVTFSGTSGSWTMYVIQEKYMYSGTHAETNGFGHTNWVENRYPNLMNANATQRFIDLTYKPYFNSLDKADQIVGVFTDEPSLMEAYINTSSTYPYAQVSWVQGFEDAFQSMHGYSIRNKIHYIFSGDSDEAKAVRTNYRQTVGELVANNYFGKLSDICEEYGTKSSGHLLMEEALWSHPYYYGDFMQCIRAMGIPGVDVLTGKLDSYNNNLFMAVKYASSVATIAGKGRLVMEEYAPTDYSDIWVQLTDDEILNFRATVNLSYFHGATHMNAYFSPSALKSQANYYMDYFARLEYIARQAKWDGGVAMYYPINTIQAYSKPSTNASTYSGPSIPLPTYASTLFQNHLDFTMIDNTFLSEATVANGKIYNNYVSFNAIVMPNVEVIPLGVMQKVIQFQNSGGTVIWLQKKPTLSPHLSETSSVKSLASNISVYSSLDTNAISAIKNANAEKLNISGASSTLYVGRYEMNDAPMYWLYNNSTSERTLNLTYEGAKGFDVYNPFTDKVTRYVGDSVDVYINFYAAVFVTVIK